MEISDKELFGFFKENQFVLDEAPNSKIWENLQSKLSKPFWLSNAFLLSVFSTIIIGVVLYVFMHNKNDSPVSNKNTPVQDEKVIPIQTENDSIKKKNNITIKQQSKPIVEFKTKEDKEIKQLPQNDTIKRNSSLPFKKRIDSEDINKNTVKTKNVGEKIPFRTFQKQTISSDTIKIKNEELLLQQTEVNLLENLKIDSLNSVKELKMIELKGIELKGIEPQGVKIQ